MKIDGFYSWRSFHHLLFYLQPQRHTYSIDIEFVKQERNRFNYIFKPKTADNSWKAALAAKNNILLLQENLPSIKDIFIKQTPLKLIENDADILVEGSIVGYDVKPISAQGNETTSQSRFTISISVTFTNNIEPDKSFNQRFSRYRDFSSDNLFADVENDLVSEINQELAEDVLNRAIANW